MKGITPSQAGSIVAKAALSWCVIAYLQGGWDSADQGRGLWLYLLVAIGITIVFWVPVVTVTVAVIGQIIAGIGIGLAHQISGVVAFSEGGVGKTSANLQDTEKLFTAYRIIGTKWTIYILCTLSQGPKKFSEIYENGAFHLRNDPLQTIKRSSE